MFIRTEKMFIRTEKMFNPFALVMRKRDIITIFTQKDRKKITC